MIPQTLGVSYRDHITNEEVKTITGNAIGQYEDLTSEKRRKCKWHGSPRLAKITWTGQDLSYTEQHKDGDKEADRGYDGKTTSKCGLTLNGTAYCRNPRAARSGGSCL